MVNLRSPVVKDFVTNSSSRTKPQPTFIMVNLLSLVDKPYLFPLLGLFKQVTLWWQPSSLTKSPLTFIMVNLLSLVDKPYLYPLWARQASGPSDDNHLPCRYHRQHCSEDSAFDNTISSLAFSNPAACSHIENQARGHSDDYSAQLLTDIDVAPYSRGCGSRHLFSSPTNEYQDVADSLSEYLTLHFAQNECRNNFHVQFKWIISRVCRY